MKVLLDNKKIKNISFTDGGMNSIGYQSLNEVFFDIYEFQSSGVEFLKEKKGDFNGNPIIEADLNLENQIYKNVRFVLGRHDGIIINPKLLDHSNVMIYEGKISDDTKKPSKSKKSLITEKNLVKESKEKFYKTIREELIDEIKKEVRSGIIAELVKSNIKENFNSFLKEDNNQSELSTLFREENEKFRKELIDVTQKIARREGMLYGESGGGSNATQYANGGTMNGNLIVNGTISCNELISDNIPTTPGTSNLSKKSFDIIGNGSTTSYNIQHNLNTLNVIAIVYDANTNEQVITYVKNVDENNTIIDINEIIPLDVKAYKVVIIG